MYDYLDYKFRTVLKYSTLLYGIITAQTQRFVHLMLLVNHIVLLSGAMIQKEWKSDDK